MDENETENWTNVMDRGGLYHVNDTVHQLFFIKSRVTLGNIFRLKLQSGVKMLDL